MIEYKHSDLLQSDAEALVNTVNTVGIMGKGIALQFREHFPDNFRVYQKACKDGALQVGKNLLTATGQLTGPKYIINFPTKTDWRSNTKLDYIHRGLDDLVRIIKEKDIRSIAIPPLGCGNGGLDWTVVKPIIEEKLAPLSDSVHIEIYEPGHHSYTRTTYKSKTPPLTKARALVLALAERYNILGFDLSHLEIQKLAYFLQEFGQKDLNLRYTKGAYGPYATNLKHLLAYLEGYYFKGQIRFQDMKPTDGLLLVGDRLEEIHRFLDDQLSEEEKVRLEKVSTFIEGFESPLGLELLATVYWARKELATSSTGEIVEYIRQWSSRKRDLMPARQIEIALERVNASF
ncbi:MAG TPA: macro domain-containing protein [Puia sp.]|nr:macro domain-containing protein [Puia sp.]